MYYYLYSGTFREDTLGEALINCDDCTAGYYCPTAAMTAPLVCGTGYYSPPAQINCTTCDPGRYCNSNTTSETLMNTEKICPAGVECPGGVAVQPDLVQNECRSGYYCPQGDVNPYPVPCPIATYSNETGLKQVSQCSDCTAGYYCNETGLTDPSGECPGGYYCPIGTGDAYTFPCPIGFYRNGSAKESFQDCAECTPGHYCNSEGLAIPVDCPRGNHILNLCFKLFAC